MDTPIDGTLLNVGCRPKVFRNGIGLTEVVGDLFGQVVLDIHIARRHSVESNLNPMKSRLTIPNVTMA